MDFRLTKETREYIIKNDFDLFGPIAAALNLKVVSVQNYIDRNSKRLTENTVLNIIASHMNVPESELYEDIELLERC